MSSISNLRSEKSSDGEPEPQGPTFRRTRQGSEELVVRRMDLDPEQRQLLLYANGRRSIDALTSLIPTLEDNPDILLGMESAGLIEMIDPDLGEVMSRSTGPSSSESNGGRAQETGNEKSRAPESGELSEIKRDLTADLSSMLGDESRDAVRRVQAVSDAEELKPLLKKFYDLTKLYGGAKAGERFLARYGDWMR